MCRILGYFGKKTLSEDNLIRAINRQLNGGPDAQTFKTGAGWALTHNRLAIQGLQGGKQPFFSNNIHAVYNGEIYNHKELKKFLSTKGYNISDTCDGSVIIPLYEIYGDDFVTHLDGMFAIAIIDERKNKKIILASDTACMKSVYYHEDKANGTLFFSSELNPLFEMPVPKKLRKEAINEYLTGRSIWYNKTFFEEIYSLPPSSILIKEENKPIKIQKYHSLLIERFNPKHDFTESSLFFDDLLHQEINKIVQADVPVCLVTSGGLDSSLVTSIAAKYIKNIECFNIAYEGNWPSDEKRYAKEVADLYGIKYNQVLIKENEFPDILGKTIEHLGQPNSAPHSLSTYALFKFIHQANFKVAITGEGADEFFGGYDRFKAATFNQSANWLEEYFDTMCATTKFNRNQTYSNDYIQFLKNPHEFVESAAEKILASAASLGRLKAMLKFDQLERFPSYILRRVDHLSMAHAVEVRIPFCQPKIINYAASLPDEFLIDQSNVKKIVYKAAHSKLPASILNRPKQPFTLPIVAMLQKGHILFNILLETLSSQSFKNRGFFKNSAIVSLINSQLSKPNLNAANMLWSLMVLELWLQKHNLSFHL